MGVSWVFEHEKTAKEVERLLEGGGAEQIGTFTVDCLPYIPNDKLQSCIQHNYVLHHSNFPQSSFSIGRFSMCMFSCSCILFFAFSFTANPSGQMLMQQMTFDESKRY
ncbi:hypothetical protein Y032_0026g1337 [Ancylostoma ceylanicum]|uniref:Mediator of RNA polymerase II transcription subunit 20 n=1 Tax=Ancylostoma ceylanicum TaxID=53326 RepID=A0A016UTH4_9BILA|nr:hypothetical protein Y032_0026g1337 [Ancylostoma ceylanicum]